MLWTAKLQLAVDIFIRFIRQYYAALNGVQVAVSKTTRVFMHVRITARRRREAHNRTSVPVHLMRQNSMAERVFSFYVLVRRQCAGPTQRQTLATTRMRYCSLLPQARTLGFWSRSGPLGCNKVSLVHSRDFPATLKINNVVLGA